jgi:hypothetical protein
MRKLLMTNIVPNKKIENLIHLIRGQKVMLDYDLASLYGVETKLLKRAVRRNQDRFPDDFLFELTREDLENLRYQIGTSSWGGMRYPPFAFTENGVAMLSSVLKSKQAIMVNIQIMRAFTRMRVLITSDITLRNIIEEHEKRLNVHDNLIQQSFDIVKKVLTPDPYPVKTGYSPSGKRKMGFGKKRDKK